MQGAVGIKRLLVLAACAAGLLMALLAAAPAAKAITSETGRTFILSDIAGARGDLFRTTTSNTWKRLTFGLSYPESISADPRGKFVTLCATKGTGGIYRIYRISANGGRMKNLIGNRAGCAPAVSPDGRKVAYIESGARTNLLRVVSSKGGKPRTIYRFCSSCLFRPVWSGKRIYFERRITRNFSSKLEIYSVRASDGKGLRRHTNSSSTVDIDLEDVSPNGRRMVAELTDSSGLGRDDLVLLNSRGVEVKRISVGYPTIASFAGAAFSPDGKRVVFNSFSVNETSPFATWFSSSLSNPLIFSSPLYEPAISSTAAYDGPYAVDWVKR